MSCTRLALKLIAIVFFAVQFIACGGGNHNSDLGPDSDSVIVLPEPEKNEEQTPSVQPPTTVEPQLEEEKSRVIVSGFLSYDRVNFGERYSAGLNYDDIERFPMRGVVVYAIDADNKIIARTSSSELGDYSLQVPENTDIKIRVGAKLENTVTTRSPAWDITVKDNTRGGMAYVLEGSLVSSGSETEQVRNFHAGSGWEDGSYQNSRSSAPFAILDSIYDSLQTIIAAADKIILPKLAVYWSENNIAVNGSHDQGLIGSSMYTSGYVAIYILGKADNDADEFDRAVIQHEFGHYIEDQVSRSESIGGSHNLDTELDMRVAFGEAWGNAFAAISSNDSIYRDSFGGQQRYGFYFDVESNVSYKPGWFSERSLQSIIYDLYDSADDGADTVSLGASAIIRAMTSQEYLGFDGAASIYPLIDLLKRQNPESNRAINDLLAAHDIYGQGMYGDGETNDANLAHILPIYHSLSFGQSVNVCSGGATREYNGADVNRFILLDIVQADSYTIEAVKSGGSVVKANPQFHLYKSGEFLRSSRSSTLNRESLKMNLPQGVYLLQIYEQANADNRNDTGGLSCFDVSLNGVSL